MGQPFEYRMTTKLPFGKHKGRTIGDLLNGTEKESQYVAWLYNESVENPNPDWPKTWATDVQNLISFKSGGKVPPAQVSTIQPLSDDEVPF